MLRVKGLPSGKCDISYLCFRKGGHNMLTNKDYSHSFTHSETLLKSFSTIILLICLILMTSSTNAQQPQPTVTITMQNQVITIGQESIIDVSVVNSGSANSDEGGITLSFPEFSGSGDGSYVRLISGGNISPSFLECPGGFYPIFNSSCQPIAASYLLAEVDDDQWEVNKTNSITIGVIPQKTGSFKVNIRSAMHKLNTTCTYVNAPSSSNYRDWQQGWPVYRRVITVHPLEPPSLNSPSNRSIVSRADPILSWNSSVAATWYHLQVRDNSGTIIVDQSKLTDKSYQLSGLSYNEPYYWKVRAVNGLAYSSYSSERSFSVQNAPSDPVLK